MTGDSEDVTGADAPETADDEESAAEVPRDVVADAERLTRLAREATDEAEAEAYRAERATLLEAEGFAARVRADDDVLVLYPQEWLADGLVQMDQVEDVDRGIERPLDGPGESEAWAAVDAHNRAVAEAVTREHGRPHGETAAALADFASNHLARRIETTTEAERTTFREEYFPRNAWPSEAQRTEVEQSVTLTVATAERLSDSQ
jgi:hypothetical protein